MRTFQYMINLAKMHNEYNTLELRVQMQCNSDCYQHQNNVTKILEICLIWNSFGVCFGGIRVTHLFTFHVLCFFVVVLFVFVLCLVYPFNVAYISGLSIPDYPYAYLSVRNWQNMLHDDNDSKEKMLTYL